MQLRLSGLTAAAAAAVLVFGAAGARAGDITWHTDYKQAVSQAKSSNKLIMVDFYTDWCGFCKKLDQTTYRDDGVVSRSGRVVPVKLNAEKEGAPEARRYGVHAYPTILFVKADGKVAGKVMGYRSGSTFSWLMDRVVAMDAEFPALQARHAQNKADGVTLEKLALAYALRDDRKQAKQLLGLAKRQDPTNKGGYLAAACNVLGDGYLLDQDVKTALPLFQTAAKTGRGPQEVAYANLQTAICHLTANRYKQAVPYLKRAAAVPGSPADVKKDASDILTELKQHGIS